MKAFKAVYRHGKLYDGENNKRILIKEEGRLNLPMYDNQLMQEDPYNKPLSGKGSEELKLEIESKNIIHLNYWLKKNNKLFFKIKAGKNTETKKHSTEYDFTARLLSNIIFMRKPKKQYMLIYPCASVVEETSTSVSNFEPIYAYSLNYAGFQ
jgi:hypothetical protein